MCLVDLCMPVGRHYHPDHTTQQLDVRVRLRLFTHCMQMLSTVVKYKLRFENWKDAFLQKQYKLSLCNDVVICLKSGYAKLQRH